MATSPTTARKTGLDPLVHQSDYVPGSTKSPSGVGSGGSSMSSETVPGSTIPLPSRVIPPSGERVVPLSTGREEKKGESPLVPLSSGSSVAEDEVHLSLPNRVAKKVGRILQHFAIRTPHIFASTGSVFLITKYYFNQPALANDAATFVGTAGAVYCLLRPFFLETIPYSILPQDNKLWRESINVSNTVFITLTLSSAVWGLDVSAVAGTAMWAASFGVPFVVLGTRYPAIDAYFKSNP